jgi:hypothetical protein
VAEYTVGDEGASVFDADGHLLAVLRPGTVVVPGVIPATVEPRGADQTHPTRYGYDDKVIRPEFG